MGSAISPLGGRFNCFNRVVSGLAVELEKDRGAGYWDYSAEARAFPPPGWVLEPPPSGAGNSLRTR